MIGHNPRGLMHRAREPIDVARRLRAEGERVGLLLAAAPGPFPARSLVAIRPDDEIATSPSSGAGLPAIAPRLVHGAHGHGVWIGAIAYDGGLGLLGIPSRHDPAAPAFAATYHATYAVFDHDAGGWDLVGPAGPAGDALAAAIACPLPAGAMPAVGARAARSAVDRAGHEAACREAMRLIAAGEMFEVNLAHVIEVPWERDGFDLFERLVAESAGDLLGSEKDRAENVMIVDLLRNDLTATAVPGSVQVAELCALERTASVMHLVSAISCLVRDDVRQPDVLVSCFPGGSVTGAPKRRAMEIIDRLEQTPRGFYCGSLFAWEPADRRLVASIAIRTATVGAGVARYGAGGAITLLSDPALEADETIAKARPFLAATNATLVGW